MNTRTDVMSRIEKLAGQQPLKGKSLGIGRGKRILSVSSASRRREAWRRRSMEQKFLSFRLRSWSSKRRDRIPKKVQDQVGWGPLPRCLVATRAETTTSSLLQPDLKHKIFLSHSRAQKDFVEQLCVDLESRGFLWPFFDKREHSLPKGKDVVPLIKEAAQRCAIAVLVLTEEFLCSKWPMIELAEFHGAQQAGNSRLNMLPLFYKFSVNDLDEYAIEKRWMPKWRQLADGDASIDVEKWRDAVRALTTVNGLVFNQKEQSEVAFRKDVVRSIFKLSPPDLMYGSSEKMIGYTRLCKMVSDRFVRGSSGGPSFLGLYGIGGVGKTTLCKALCDSFGNEYMGRVCYVDMGRVQRLGKRWDGDLNATLRLRRQKQMLERLCGLEKEVLDRITDFDESLTLMRMHMKREPVLLVIDDVTNESSCWNEVHEYLEVGFHPESRIVITSRSKQVIWDLVPDIPSCVPMPMPRLSATEAGELFLKSAAPSKSISGLTAQERRLVGLCIEQCMYDDPDQGGLATLIGEDEVGLLSEVHADMSFHPMALSALGSFFRRYFRYGDMLQWMGYLEEYKDPLQGLWAKPDGIGGNIRSQLQSVPSSEQLLFLDIAIFSKDVYYTSDDDLFTRLCKVHEETEPVMKRRLQDLERVGLITLDWDEYDSGVSHISMNGLYRRYVEWYMTIKGVRQLKNA